MDSIEVIPVNLGDRSYEIFVGTDMLKDIGETIQRKCGQRKILIVTDQDVASFWLSTVVESLKRNRLDFEVACVPPGESSKSFYQLESLLDQFFEAQLARDGLILAFGGGVVGDLAGFAAAIALRGIDFIQVPTTLLAQVDSSVGGKTGINTSRGKNLVGSFYQPKLVIIDTGVLDSLPKRQLRAGYAEIVKYGLIKNKPFFEWLEINGQKVISGDSKARQIAIVESCKIKAMIVGQDEREAGERALLNFGHTFGHAFEAEARYNGELLHGEAVALGIVAAMNLSKTMGFLNSQELDRVTRHFKTVGLPINLNFIDKFSDWNVDALIDHMRHDKKVLKGKMRFILLREIGNSFITSDIMPENVAQILSKSIRGKL